MIWKLVAMWKDLGFWRCKTRRSSSAGANSATSHKTSNVKRQRQWLRLRRTASQVMLVEEQMQFMQNNLIRLLDRLSQQEDDIPLPGMDECVICTVGRAHIQTFPCGHRVLCKKCFIRTIQVGMTNGQLPLRCVLCRSRIVKLKDQPNVAKKRVMVKVQQIPHFQTPIVSQ